MILKGGGFHMTTTSTQQGSSQENYVKVVKSRYVCNMGVRKKA